MKNIVFGNNSTTLSFNADSGYLEGINYGDKIIPLHSKLWSIQTTVGELTISDMASFRYEEYSDNIKLIWDSETAKVTVGVLLGEDDKIRMNIRTEVFNGAVRRVKFPIIEGLNFKDDNYLLIAYQNGHLMKNPVDVFLSKGVEVPFWMAEGVGAFISNYPAGTNYQYTTFYSPSDFGYYFATEDGDAYIKTYEYAYNKERHAMNYIVTNYPENMGKTTSYCMPYDFVVKLFNGDWQDATSTYRAWATKQKWCDKKLSERTLPEKLVKTDLWRINHMDYELGTRTDEYFETSKQIRDAVGGNLTLHWYGWNMSEHDKDYPEYISDEKKAEGWPAELTKWNSRFDNEEIVKLPYVNARLWETALNSWEKALPSAVKDEDGNTLKEPWYENKGFDLRPICPTTAFWQNKVIDFCREYGTDVGFDGIYLDQIGSFNATLCFDESHPHPLGGGTWWNDSYHNMLRGIRNVLGNERIITTESCCETYIDFFDIFLVLDTCFQHTGFNWMTQGGDTVSIPLFSMIYGDYALSYGSACQFSNATDRFELNLVRNLIWGILPCVEGGSYAELDSQLGKEKIAIVKRVVDFYKENKDIFLFGRLCEIPKCECETLSVNLEVEEVGIFEETIPAIFASIWESKSGEKYIFAYNFSDSACSFKTSTGEYSISGKSFCSFKI